MESIVEEPEYIYRYLTIKHSWRGRYKRIFCLSETSIITLDPLSLAVTNHYDLVTDFESVSLGTGREDPQALEFTINVRVDGKGKFKPVRLSCRYRAALLTQLYRTLAALHDAPSPPPPQDVPVVHLRYRSKTWAPYVLRITAVGVELVQEGSRDARWCLDFRDMASPGITFLHDLEGRSGSDPPGFVLCPLYGRNRKAFAAGPRASNKALVAKIVELARAHVGVRLLVDFESKLDIHQFAKQRAEAAVGAVETPMGEWSAVRHRPSAHGTAPVPPLAATLGVQLLREPGWEGVTRQLVLTHSSLLERRTNNYEVVVARPLGSISALVRFAEEPQLFAVEFSDGCPAFMYSSTSRDFLLASVRDAAQTEGQRPVPVLPRLTMPGHLLNPPCSSVEAALPSPQGMSHHRLFGDVDGEQLHVRHLTAAAKDAVAESGSIPGSKARLWRRVREFNACVPYSGLQANTEVPDVTLMAILSMLPAPPNLPPDAPCPPAPPQKAAATFMGLVACLRRLLTAQSAASLVIAMPGAVARIMGMLRNGSEGVASEAAGLLAMLIGGGPGVDQAVASQTRGELYASLAQAKGSLLANPSHATALVNRLKPAAVSPLLSASLVEILEAMLCEPHSETTDDDVFFNMLRQVANLRRRLFALFGHPAESTREIVAVLMRTIAVEDDGGVAEPMRDAAMQDGALLRHLASALFLPPGERREVSRQLVALWAEGHPPALSLLARCIPPGLVAYLHTTPSQEQPMGEMVAAGDLNFGPSRSRLRRILQTHRGRGSRNAIGPGGTAGLDGQPETSGRLREVQGTAGRRLEGRRSSEGMSPRRNETLTQSLYGSIGLPATAGLASHSTTTGVNGGSGTNPEGQGQSVHEASAPVVETGAAQGLSPPHPLGPDQMGASGASENARVARNEASGSEEPSAPAQVVPSGGALPLGGAGNPPLNWPQFWREFWREHHRADLIWNERTRQELREALEGEVHHLDVERERAPDATAENPPLYKEASTGGEVGEEQTKGQLSWNYSEFGVCYPSLASELCVGHYYLRLLLEGGAMASGGAVALGLAKEHESFPLRNPAAFFQALYHRFLCEADGGLTLDGTAMDQPSVPGELCDLAGLDGFGGWGGSSVRELCARAMAIVYEQHHAAIGPFEGTGHITVLLDRTSDRALRHRLLLLLQALVKVPENAEACVAVGGCQLAVSLLATAHEAGERMSTPLQSNLIAATAYLEATKEWFYMLPDGTQVGPLEKDGLRRAASLGEIGLRTRCWAAGLPEWRCLRDIRELRFALSKGNAVLTPAQVGEVALAILKSMVAIRSDLDAAGEILTPAPRVKRILSSLACLPHIAQALLTGEPAIVEGASSLLAAVLSPSSEALARLYRTGAFFFALAYGGSNLSATANLLAATHERQAFHGGAEAAAMSSLPLAKRSVLGALLPESLLYVLERGGAAAFAAAMVADLDTPEIIWTHRMRGQGLIAQIQIHLGDFPRRLAQHCHLVYDYAPMPPLTYPELADEMWCHRYYLHNLCDEVRFPDWPIVEHVEFLQSLLAMWREELTRRPLDLSEEEACAILEIPLDEAEPAFSGGAGREFDSAGKGTRGCLIEEEVLKRQYRKLAMKYHPDKNPQGHDHFMALHKAYERLQASLQGLQGPQPWRLLLLLRAQCILFKRYGDVLAPFKYAAYPLLLEAITLGDQNGNFLSPERSPLLEAAADLIWLTCSSSALNGEELVREGGIGLLATLLTRCMNVVGPATPPSEPAAAIVTSVMRTFAVLSKFPSACAEILDCPGLVPELVHCTELEQATSAVEAGLQAISQLAADQALQEQLLRAGAIWYLLPLLLQYDATAVQDEAEPEAGGAKDPPPYGESHMVQTARNSHAALAAKGLARLGGCQRDELATPPNPQAANVLRALLTPNLASMLEDPEPKKLLRSVTSNLETPEVIWNGALRTELLRYVEVRRGDMVADGTYDLDEATSFQFRTLSSEVQVGNVYLRVYNEQPDFEIADPHGFCTALLEYMNTLLDLRRANHLSSIEEVDVRDDHQTEGEASGIVGRDEGNQEVPHGSPTMKQYLLERSESVRSNVELVDVIGFRIPDDWERSIPEEHAEGLENRFEEETEMHDDEQAGDSTANGKRKDRQANQHLVMALKALQNVLAADPAVASELASKPQLAPLFGCLTDVGPTSGEVPVLALRILARLTTHAPCVEAMVVDKGDLLLLLQLLHLAPQCREGTLRVLYAVASTPEMAWVGAKHGGILYILHLLLPVHERVSAQDRAAAASLLGKLIAQPMHGSRVVIALQRFLPDGIIAALRDGPGDAVVALLSQISETPELVWSPAMAVSLAAQLAAKVEELQHEQTKEVDALDGGEPSQGGAHADVAESQGGGFVRGEPQVGGVYVRLFLKDPKFPLRNPKRFLEGLLDQYVAAAAAARTGSISGAAAEEHVSDAELPLLLSAALVSLLRVQPGMAIHVAHLGYLPKLIATMAAEGGRAVMSAGAVSLPGAAAADAVLGEGDYPGGPTGQERVRLSCLRVIHQLASSVACTEAMSTPGIGTPQIIPLLMKAIGWPGGSILALETMKRVLASGNRTRDALVAQGLRVGLVPVLLGLLDWRAGGHGSLEVQMKWNESEASIGRVLAVEVLHGLAAEGAHSARVSEILSSSEIWQAYKGQRHDLFLPSNAQSAATGVAGLIEGSSGATKYALPAPRPAREASSNRHQRGLTVASRPALALDGTDPGTERTSDRHNPDSPPATHARSREEAGEAFLERDFSGEVMRRPLHDEKPPL